MNKLMKNRTSNENSRASLSCLHKIPSLPLVATTLLTGLCLVACVQTGGEKPNQETPAAIAQKPRKVVRLGHAAPMTGPMAHLGRDSENGARLAVEEINASQLEIGGATVVFELVSKDDQANPNRAVEVARQLADAKVNGVVGHLNSGATILASRIYSDAGIPQVSGSSTNPKYTHQGYRTAFRVIANDIQQGKMLGRFAVERGYKSVAIIDDNTMYGQILKENFQNEIQAARVKIVAVRQTSDRATNFKSLLAEIKAKRPELIFYAGMDDQSGLMVRQMKELGLDATLLTGDGGCTPQFIALGGDASHGHLCALPVPPLDKMPRGIEFKKKFVARFNREVQLYAPYTYDAVMVVADAMKRSGSIEAEQYLPQMHKTDYEGATGSIGFDENGDLSKGRISIYHVKGSRFEYLETIAGQ